MLDRRGQDIVVTEEVVNAAAENKECGERVMTLLLDRRGQDVVIIEELIKATAENVAYIDIFELAEISYVWHSRLTEIAHEFDAPAYSCVQQSRYSQVCRRDVGCYFGP